GAGAGEVGDGNPEMVELHHGSRHGWTPAPRGYGSATVSWRSQASAASRSSLKILTSSVPLPLVGDLLRVLGDGAGGDDGADPAVGQRLAGGRIAHLRDRVLDQVHAARLGALVGEHAEIRGAEALARHDPALILHLAAHRLGEWLGADLRDPDRQRADAHLL